MDRTLTNTNSAEAANNTPDIQVHGDPDAWVCVCKASSKSQGWMKSTKVMQLPGGVLVQVTEMENRQPATALTYVPGAKLDDFQVPLSR